MGYYPQGSLVHAYESVVMGHDLAGTLLTGSPLYPSPHPIGTIRGAVQLPTGEIMITCQGGSGSSDRASFYDKDFNYVTGISYSNFTGGPGTSHSATHFYLLGSNTTINKYTAAGAFVSTTTISGMVVTAGQFGVSQDGTFAIAVSSSDRAYKIDMSTGVATMLFAEPDYSQQTALGGVLVLQDDTFIITWQDFFEPRSHIKKYSSTGTLQWNYNPPSSGATAGSMFFVYACLGLDASKFYTGVSRQLDAGAHTGTVEMVEVDSSTGSATSLFTKAWPTSGDSFNAYDNSAMFMWLGEDEPTGPPAPTTPPAVLVNSDPCCCAADSPAGTTNVGRMLPPIGPTWTPSCEGAGVIPVATPITLIEAWDY